MNETKEQLFSSIQVAEKVQIEMNVLKQLAYSIGKIKNITTEIIKINATTL